MSYLHVLSHINDIIIIYTLAYFHLYACMYIVIFIHIAQLAVMHSDTLDALSLKYKFVNLLVIDKESCVYTFKLCLCLSIVSMFNTLKNIRKEPITYCGPTYPSIFSLSHIHRRSTRYQLSI